MPAPLEIGQRVILAPCRRGYQSPRLCLIARHVWPWDPRSRSGYRYAAQCLGGRLLLPQANATSTGRPDSPSPFGQRGLARARHTGLRAQCGRLDCVPDVAHTLNSELRDVLPRFLLAHGARAVLRTALRRAPDQRATIGGRAWQRPVRICANRVVAGVRLRFVSFSPKTFATLPPMMFAVRHTSRTCDSFSSVRSSRVATGVALPTRLGSATLKSESRFSMMWTHRCGRVLTLTAGHVIIRVLGGGSSTSSALCEGESV